MFIKGELICDRCHEPSEGYCELVPRVEDCSDHIDLCRACWQELKTFLNLVDSERA